MDEEVRFEVEIKSWHGGNPKIDIVIQDLRAWVRKPLPESNPKAPDNFRCFVCLEKRVKADFAAWILNQPVCRICYPYVDEQLIGGIIRFDIRHGYGARIKE